MTVLVYLRTNRSFFQVFFTTIYVSLIFTSYYKLEFMPAKGTSLATHAPLEINLEF